MRVVVQLKLPEALALQGAGPPTVALRQILQVTEAVGAELRPVHPGATHALLAPYFVVDVRSRTMAEQLIDQLLPLEAVVSAHVEPPLQPP